jgi:hypothetical protein
VFRPAAVKRVFQEHRAKHRDHYDRIWRLLNLELWFRVFLEGEPHEPGMTRLEEAKSAVALASA